MVLLEIHGDSAKFCIFVKVDQFDSRIPWGRLVVWIAFFGKRDAVPARMSIERECNLRKRLTLSRSGQERVTLGVQRNVVCSGNCCDSVR